MSEPIYRFRVIRKGLCLEDARAVVKRQREFHPEGDFRIVVLDGAKNSHPTFYYRVLMLRPA